MAVDPNQLPQNDVNVSQLDRFWVLVAGHLIVIGLVAWGMSIGSIPFSAGIIGIAAILGVALPSSLKL